MHGYSEAATIPYLCFNNYIFLAVRFLWLQLLLGAQRKTAQSPGAQPFLALAQKHAVSLAEAMRPLFPPNTHMKRQVEDQAWVSCPVLSFPHPKLGPNCDSPLLLVDSSFQLLPRHVGCYNVLGNGHSLMDLRIDSLGLVVHSDPKLAKPNRKDLLIR